MNVSQEQQGLGHEHHPEAIRERLEEQRRHSYLRDGVLGAMDGAITTFAIVAGAVGGALRARWSWNWAWPKYWRMR